MLGRAFRPEEDDLASEPVAILSHGLWQRRFGANRDIIGKTIKVAKGGAAYVTYIVVGVMPRDLPVFGNVEVWLSQPAKEQQGTNRGWPGGNLVGVIARLKPGVTLAQAQKEMEVISSRIYQTYPDFFKEGWAVSVTPIRDVMVSELQRHLLIVFAVVGCVMLIACANVANLLLVRAAARQREIAIRAVVGASRWRLIRQLLVESLLLAGLGGALGVLLAIGGIRLLSAFAPSGLYATQYRSELPLEAISVDGQALAFTCLLALLTGVLFGLVPALRASKPDLNNALKDGGRTATAAPGGQRLTKLLVVGQMALALVLVTGAGLLANSVLRLANEPLGYDPRNLLRMEMNLSPRSKFVEPSGKTLSDGTKLWQPKPQRDLVLGELLQRIRRLPGVQAVAVKEPGFRWFYFAVEGQMHAPGWNWDAQGWHEEKVVRLSPDGFRTMGMRLLKGRDFSERDRAGTPPVAVVNEAFARRYLPNRDPLGKQLVDAWGEQREIVGVVADNYAIMGAFGLGYLPKEKFEAMYWPLLQPPLSEYEGCRLDFMIRTGAGLKPTAAALCNVVREVDKEQPIPSISSMEETVAKAYAMPRFYALVFGGFAGLALILSAIGVYGVMAFSVTQRTHEIGIRLAMGAEQLDVLKLVVRQGMRLALLGVAIGLAGAMAATRALSSWLYGITPTDPLTFGGVTLLLTGVAFLACYIPARRATKVNPMTALRYE